MNEFGFVGMREVQVVWLVRNDYRCKWFGLVGMREGQVVWLVGNDCAKCVQM